MTFVLSALVCDRTSFGGKTNWIETSLDALTVLTVLYSPSATVLFCILCQIASKNLGQIRQQTNELIADKPVDAVNRLDHIKEYYFRNTEFVYQINSCFGIFLLLEISNGLFQIIVQIFSVVAGVLNSQSSFHLYASLCFLSLYAFNILIIVHVSENVIEEVYTFKIKQSHILSNSVSHDCCFCRQIYWCGILSNSHTAVLFWDHK